MLLLTYYWSALILTVAWFVCGVFEIFVQEINKIRKLKDYYNIGFLIL